MSSRTGILDALERGHCPEAESYFKDTLSIPMFAGLSLEDQEIVVHTLKEVLG